MSASRGWNRTRVLGLGALLAACDSSVTVVPPTDAGTSDAGRAAGDECSVSAECPGGTRVALTPGGLRVCQIPPIEPATCDGTFDECCAALPCTLATDRCVRAPSVPYCGGAQMLEHNVCASDPCASDAECTGGVCLPAGTLGRKVRACITASCTSDTCDVEEGGAHCRPGFHPCPP